MRFCLPGHLTSAHRSKWRNAARVGPGRPFSVFQRKPDARFFRRPGLRSSNPDLTEANPRPKKASIVCPTLTIRRCDRCLRSAVRPGTAEPRRSIQTRVPTAGAISNRDRAISSLSYIHPLHHYTRSAHRPQAVVPRMTPIHPVGTTSCPRPHPRAGPDLPGVGNCAGTTAGCGHRSPSGPSQSSQSQKPHLGSPEGTALRHISPFLGLLDHRFSIDRARQRVDMETVVDPQWPAPPGTRISIGYSGPDDMSSGNEG